MPSTVRYDACSTSSVIRVIAHQSAFFNPPLLAFAPAVCETVGRISAGNPN
jgi:hypothetical protein